MSHTEDVRGARRSADSPGQRTTPVTPIKARKLLTVGQACRTTLDMPSPKFSFRLPAEDKKNLLELSKVYGSPSPGAFCAEMVGALCSGNANRVAQFNTKLLQKMGEQLAFDFAQKAAAQAEKSKKRPVKRKKGGKSHG